MKLSFFIPLKKIPTTTHQQKRVSCIKGKPIFYEDVELSKTRELFKSRLVEFKPEKKITKPIELICTWCFPVTSKKGHGEPMINKPDLDNLQKLFNDCMTDLGFWKDDNLIYRTILEKFHSEVVGIRVSINYE